MVAASQQQHWYAASAQESQWRWQEATGMEAQAAQELAEKAAVA